MPVTKSSGLGFLIGAALGLAGWATSAEGSHPYVALVLYVLALLVALAAGAAIVRERRSTHQQTTVSVNDWRAQEERFRRLNKNIEGHYEHDIGSRILRWSIYSSEGATARDRELFETEARMASRLLRAALEYPEGKFIGCFGSDEVDQWLNAIRPLVDPGTRATSTGRSEGRKTVGHFVAELPVMSANACVKLAAGERPRLSVSDSE